MHRSGTSAITGLFSESGYFVGEAGQLMDPDWGNPAGYHERLDTLAVNEATIDRLGGSWIDPPAPERQRSADQTVTDALTVVLEQLLQQAGDRPVAVKDPRIAALMPLWGPVISGRLHPVLVVRDPLEIAESLAARGGTPTPMSLASWEIHMASALDALQGEKVTIARYGDVMRSPELARSVVLAAGEHVDPRLRSALSVSDGTGWLRPDLYHRRLEGTPHEDHLTVHQHRIWAFLDSLPSGSLTLRPPEATMRASAGARAAAHAERIRIADVKAHEELGRRLAGEPARRHDDDAGPRPEREPTPARDRAEPVSGATPASVPAATPASAPSGRRGPFFRWWRG
jgi:hypothetical protein